MGNDIVYNIVLFLPLLSVNPEPPTILSGGRSLPSLSGLSINDSLSIDPRSAGRRHPCRGEDMVCAIPYSRRLGRIPNATSDFTCTTT